MKKLYMLFVTSYLVITAFGQQNAKSYISKLQSPSNPFYSGFQGNFSVSDNGAAVYDIPFPVTPGVGGMTPKISFSYNSNNSTSILGEGWSLNGFSVISRANSIQAIDGLTEAVKFDITDNLALDGSRLVLSKGNHGINGAEYTTENNSFKRVTVGKNSAQPINDIEYFKVETKDGLEYYYGNLDLQTINGMGGLTKAGISEGLVGIIKTKTQKYNDVPFLWLVTLIRDKNKNWIYFRYNNDYNYYSPQKIFYGGNDESTIGEIDFVYSKTISGNPNPYNWESRKFIRGDEILIDKPLEKVISYYLKPGTAVKMQVRAFDFNYDKDDLSNKLLLTKVTQSSVSYNTRLTTAITDKNNPIEFSWSKTSKATKEFTQTKIITTAEQVILSEDFKSTIADFNGDGFPDKLMHKNFGNKIVFFLSINDKKGKFININGIDTINTTITTSAKVFTGDFDADGRNDIIYLSNENNSLSTTLYSPQLDAKGDFYKFKEFKTKNISSLPAIDEKKIHYGFGDFNSDGFSDILIYYIEGNKLKYQPITFEKDKISANLLKESDRGDIPDDKYISQISDINGDGITDLFFTWTNKDGWFTKSYIINNSTQLGLSTDANEKKLYQKEINYDITGYTIDTNAVNPLSTVQPISTQIKNGDYSMLGNIMIADLNKDGNVDIVISNTSKNGWEYYTAIGKGDGQFIFSQHPKISTINFTNNYRSSFGDFNGDGLMDIIIQKTDADGWSKLIAYGNGKGDFLLKNLNDKFELFFKNNFTYSQKYLTNNVLPVLHLQEYKTLFDSKLDFVNSCVNKEDYLCIMSNIRMIFPVETGFYPEKINRSYDAPLEENRALTDFIKTDLNFDNNVKKIVAAEYFGNEHQCVYSIMGACLGDHVKYTKITYGDYWQPYIIDLNGDGISDLFLTYPIQIPNDKELNLPKNELEDKLYSFTAINQSEKPGFVNEITHSNKSKTKISYASILLNHESGLPKAILSYPYISFNSSLYTVYEVGVSDGIAINSLRRTRYIYRNGIASLNGRGFLGFLEQKVINTANKNYSIKTFVANPSFMEKGLMPLESNQTFIYGIKNNVSEDRYQYSIIVDSSINSFNLYCVYQNSNTHDINNFTTSESRTESSYDKYGNLIYAKTTRGKAGEHEIIKKVSNKYYESDGNSWEQDWLLGRLQYTTVKTIRDKDSVTRTSYFEYDPNNGQLLKEISDTGNIKFSLTKEYKLNKFGNIGTSNIYPSFSKFNTRGIVTSYSLDNRFVINTIDAGGYTTTKTIEPVQGLQTSIMFAEAGNKTVVSADEIGRFQTITSSDTTILKTERRIYNSGEFSDIATYFLLETNNISNFSLPTVTFYNSADKVVRKVTFDFKDREIITEYSYDTYGNLLNESLPYFKGSKANRTSYAYDKLSRKILTTLPDGSTIKIKYFGLSDTIINAKDQKSISKRNILGELESSIDHDGFSVNYTYDLFSRIKSIASSDNRVYTMEYDINGNRIAYKNPNFTKPEKDDYNAFNQKISSLDPNGYPKYFEYDKLDRLKVIKAERPGFKERIEYTYVEQSDNNIAGKGKIRSIKSFSDDHPIDEEFTYFSSGQLKSHTYRYFNINQRMGHGYVFTYSGSATKDNLTYNYTYDKSQVKTVTYPFTGQIVDRKLTVQYSYLYGTLVSAVGLTSGNQVRFWDLINSNSLGLTTSYKLGDSIISNQLFDDKLFNVEKIEYTTNKRILSGIKYDYDIIGNLIYRQDINSANNYDSIFYDNLNRVIEVKTNSYSTKVQYYANGDLKQKVYGGDHQLDFTYQLGTNKFKTVKETEFPTGETTIDNTFEYDNYGNEESTFSFLIAKKNVHIEYNQYNLPFSIDNLKFYYSFDGSKDAIYDYRSHTGITYLGNLSEFNYQFNNGDEQGDLKYQKMKILVNGKIVANLYSNSGKIEFLLKDVLNTVIGVADDRGILIDSLSYDIWGLKRTAKNWKYNWKDLANEISNPKEKGFLNSTSFDGYGLVDFSARLYNPITGRFISVDPVTSNSVSPTQFANSYIYGYNNPTVFKDANGKFGWFVVALVVAAYAGGSAAGGSLLPWEWNDNWWKGALVGVVSIAGGYAVAGPAMFTGGMSAGTAIFSGAAAGFAGGFTAALVNGGNFIQALESGFKGGVIGGVTAGFTYGIGDAFGNPGTFTDGYFAKASLHGLNQGLASEAMGGSFENGFLAGSFTSLASPMTQITGTSPEERVIISSMVGGTASSLGGGKFVNGAISGAMVQIYNENQHNNVKKRVFDNWKNGNGKSITIDASDINLCGLSSSDFSGVGDRMSISTLYYDPENFPALGSITVKYIGGSQVKIYSDRFDWEMHDLSKANGWGSYIKEVGRNIETFIGRPLMGSGQEFNINFQGSTPIDCSPQFSLPKNFYLGPKY